MLLPRTFVQSDTNIAQEVSKREESSGEKEVQLHNHLGDKLWDVPSEAGLQDDEESSVQVASSGGSLGESDIPKRRNALVDKSAAFSEAPTWEGEVSEASPAELSRETEPFNLFKQSLADHQDYSAPDVQDLLVDMLRGLGFRDSTALLNLVERCESQGELETNLRSRSMLRNHIVDLLYPLDIFRQKAHVTTMRMEDVSTLTPASGTSLAAFQQILAGGSNYHMMSDVQDLVGMLKRAGYQNDLELARCVQGCDTEEDVGRVLRSKGVAEDQLDAFRHWIPPSSGEATTTTDVKVSALTTRFPERSTVEVDYKFTDATSEVLAGNIRTMVELIRSGATSSTERHLLGQFTSGRQFSRGDILLLVDLLQGGNHRQKLFVAKIFAGLAFYDAKNRGIITEAGGIPPLVKLIHNGSAEQKIHATDALEHLARDVDNRVIIAEEGGILDELPRSEADEEQEHSAAASFCGLAWKVFIFFLCVLPFCVFFYFESVMAA